MEYGAEVDRVQALVDSSQEDKQHHSTLHLDRVAIVGDAEGCAGLIGNLQWLQAGRVHSLARYDIDW